MNLHYQGVCAKCGAKMDRESALHIIAQMQLGPVARRLCEILAEHFGEFVQVECVAQALYAADPDGGPLDPENSISVTICRAVRPRLAGCGIVIDGRVFSGYRMRWHKDDVDASTVRPAGVS